MTAKKASKKQHGHYCYVCGEHKVNENFSGHGHANHICKKCQSLPVAQRNEMITLRKDDGIALTTYEDTPIVAETKRLRIRRLNNTDMDALFAIMKKPEVMYAWEHGFSRSDTRKWINRQLTRYHKDG